MEERDEGARLGEGGRGAAASTGIRGRPAAPAPPTLQGRGPSLAPARAQVALCLRPWHLPRSKSLPGTPSGQGPTEAEQESQPSRPIRGADWVGPGLPEGLRAPILPASAKLLP